MTDEEAVKRAADAIRAYRSSTRGGRGARYDGPSADEVLSAHVGSTGRFSFGGRWFRLAREAMRRAGLEPTGPPPGSRGGYDSDDFGVPPASRDDTRGWG